MPLHKKRKVKSKHYRLMEKAWKLCSEYVRRRDQGRCFTCGDIKEWKLQQAGHYIHGKHTPIYFHEHNVHCQDVKCNHFLSGNRDVYLRNLQKKYGMEEADRLYNQRDKVHYFKIGELEEIIEYYKEKLETVGA